MNISQVMTQKNRFQALEKVPNMIFLFLKNITKLGLFQKLSAD